MLLPDHERLFTVWAEMFLTHYLILRSVEGERHVDIGADVLINISLALHLLILRHFLEHDVDSLMDGHFFIVVIAKDLFNTVAHFGQAKHHLSKSFLHLFGGCVLHHDG